MEPIRDGSVVRSNLIDSTSPGPVVALLRNRASHSDIRLQVTGACGSKVAPDVPSIFRTRPVG